MSKYLIIAALLFADFVTDKIVDHQFPEVRNMVAEANHE